MEHLRAEHTRQDDIGALARSHTPLASLRTQPTIDNLKRQYDMPPGPFQETDETRPEYVRRLRRAGLESLRRQQYAIRHPGFYAPLPLRRE